MGRIQQLSKNVINQIAAGEVIERPASVVKELVENSIDASASKISIEISNECRDIRIADNGCGIHPDDIVLAFSKHATSKILTGDDLYNIRTFGFRGEALASIISVSKVTCITRTPDYDYGTKVVCENSEIQYAKTGCAVGTIMQITDLFYNLPARLKFIKSEKTELSYITDLITAIALANPNVSIEVKNNNKIILKTNGNGSVESVIKTIFSKDLFEHLKKVENNDKFAGIGIEGYAGTPNYTRSNKKDYHIFVNNRTVKCPVIIKAIDSAYKNSLPSGRYPFIVLNLNIPPEDIDVNVHPTKKEVKYKNANMVFNFIHTSIEQALTNFGYNKSKFEQRENIITIKNFKPETNTYSDDNTEIKTDRLKQAYQAVYNYSPPVHSSFGITKTISSAQQTISSDVTGIQEKIIGQYRDTYILIDVKDGLEIIDQHIADERYIYETLKSQAEPASQLLFISDVIKIDLKESEMLKNNLDKFQKFGYELEFLDDTDVIFKKVPQLLSQYNPKDLLADILENIEGVQNNPEEKILISISCKAAVKANTPLNLFQMEEIVSKWRKCKNPYTCPHGRPISKVIKHNEVAGFFMRNS